MKKNQVQEGLKSGEVKDVKAQELITNWEAAVDDVLEQQKANQTVLKSTLMRRLNILKDGIKKLREREVPYKMIAELIREITLQGGNELKVSEQTLRGYCQNVLGLPKKHRGNKKVETETEEIKSSNT